MRLCGASEKVTSLFPLRRTPYSSLPLTLIHRIHHTGGNTEDTHISVSNFVVVSRSFTPYNMYATLVIVTWTSVRVDLKGL